MQENEGPSGDGEPKSRVARTCSEWIARWITWLLAVVGATVLSAVAAYAVVLALQWLLGALGVPRGHSLAYHCGLTIGLMSAPVFILWVSWAVAPAGRWIVTAVLCAVAMIRFGWPRPGDGWPPVVLWFQQWIPSWITLAFLWRSGRRGRDREAEKK